MKTVRTAALMFLMTGILLISSGSAPFAIGQSPEYPRTPGMDPNVFGRSNRAASTSAQLAKQYAKATKEEEKKDVKKQLSDTLNKEFDQLAQSQQAELDQLEKQVAELKAVLKKRKDSKDTIVERRLEELILNAEGLGWGSSKQAESPYSNFIPSGLPRP